jgi:hypothetical protein
MSWKPEVQVQGEGDKWHGNALRFGTKEEAEDYAFVLFWNWTSSTAYRVVEVEDQITYALVEGRLVPVKPGDVA